MKKLSLLILSLGLLAHPFHERVWAADPIPAAPATSPAAAATKPAAPAVAKPDPYRLLSEQIRSGDPGQIDDAVAKIKAALLSDPVKATWGLRSQCLKPLLDIRRFSDVADLCQQAILLGPASDTPGLETLQSFRAQALLALGKNQEALVAAKQLFHIASMKGTSDAVLLISQCLNALEPNDREVLKRFRREQMEGAQSTTRPASPETSMLGKIAIDPAPYDEAIRALTAEDYRTLVARGNLLLLAGRTVEARETLERAYSLCDDKDLAAASENVARCMKAEDEAIGRANAWVLSIRPAANARTTAAH